MEAIRLDGPDWIGRMVVSARYILVIKKLMITAPITAERKTTAIIFQRFLMTR
jgi:hypothetical protein